MLVLSRKKNERILLGDTITIELLRIQPNQVRLGITAPKTLSIVREEIAAGVPLHKIKERLDRAENL